MSEINFEDEPKPAYFHLEVEPIPIDYPVLEINTPRTIKMDEG